MKTNNPRQWESFSLDQLWNDLSGFEFVWISIQTGASCRIGRYRVTSLETNSSAEFMSDWGEKLILSFPEEIAQVRSATETTKTGRIDQWYSIDMDELDQSIIIATSARIEPF